MERKRGDGTGSEGRVKTCFPISNKLSAPMVVVLNCFCWQCALLSCFSIGKQTRKMNDLLYFFDVGLSGKNYMVKRKVESKKVKTVQMKTFETVLKDNNHTEARLL